MLMAMYTVFISVSQGYRYLKKRNKEYTAYFSFCSAIYSFNKVTIISDIVRSCSIAKCFNSFFKGFGSFIINVSVIFNHFLFFIAQTGGAYSYI